MDMKKQLLLVSLLGCAALQACGKDGNPITAQETEQDRDKKQTTMQLKISVGDKTFLATMFDNGSTREFVKKLPLTLDMTELNGNEKYHNPKASDKLPVQNAQSGTINAGDLMVWDSSYRSLVLFYKTFESPYRYVRIAKINNTEGLQKALGTGNVRVKFELEKK